MNSNKIELLENFADHCLFFSPGKQVQNIKLDKALIHARNRHTLPGFIWLSLHQPTEAQMSMVAEVFNINDLLIEDAASAIQRPKAERYDDQLFYALHSISYSDFDKRLGSVRSAGLVIQTGTVQMIVGTGFIVTIRHNTQLPDVLKYLAEDPELIDGGPLSIVWAISDRYRRYLFAGCY
ncbi:transporter of the CorA metal ion transporter family protein [Corynebacterium kutscheri]|uniref:CorA-like Mg2+ transporter protein n=1 Tax=Corynebacterium kutscheri TaxID=35755 RepID=A0A0F6TDE7_9CORY|nr:CorA family divalent cation transporter [Corynebacterium kutscheri]AKE41184.1 CorA-like Mg2+ transporter protein [Corynebacterium kutscheri]VEH08460.1 transporter of the CorA metal ion transporter family protein [Corynebacterium kutscheri]VEH09506.1 transporter of the CorA metal ion transporter family protein [Corynebacterium kutscheri]VEH79589.1 transporter of the CorA metal ion transporter family protein [Corynebacterium kutscheri]